MRIVGSLLVLSGCLLLNGCAVRRYEAAPINPVQSASILVSRTLDDPGLHDFMEETLGHSVAPWPPKSWDLQTLSLAALYFNSQTAIDRARIEEAQAAITTEGARPNPTLSVTPGVPSPYLLGMDLAFPIETAGKRAIRVEQAMNALSSTRLNVAETTWKTYISVRSALLNHLVAVRQLELAQQEKQLTIGRVGLLEARLQVGELARPEVDATRLALSNTQLALRTTEGQVVETKALLASAVGIPSSALEFAQFSWPDLDQLPAEGTLSADTIQREAVLNRLDVRRALANYAEAESALRLEIAKQHPDVQFGPGYQFEESHSFFTVGLAVTLPLFNRNEGPIAEAEARRRQVGAEFVAVQARVIGESNAALARYRGGLRRLREAEQSSVQGQAQRERLNRISLQVGETDRLALNGILLEGLPIGRARLEALAEAQAALGELEDSLQRPLMPDELPSTVSASTRLGNAPAERKP